MAHQVATQEKSDTDEYESKINIIEDLEGDEEEGGTEDDLVVNGGNMSQDVATTPALLEENQSTSNVADIMTGFVAGSCIGCIHQSIPN